MPRFNINPPVFIGADAIILAFVAEDTAAPQAAERFGWFVLANLDRGVRRLSEFNLILAHSMPARRNSRDRDGAARAAGALTRQAGVQAGMT